MRSKLQTYPDKTIMEEKSKSGRSSDKCLLKLLIHGRTNQLFDIGAYIVIETTSELS